MPEEVVGRAGELGAIERFLGRAVSRRAGFVLEGEAGIGKTTIWEAAIGAATDVGFRVLRSRPGRAEQHLTLGGLTDLFTAVGTPELEGLPEPQRHGLEVALLRVAPTGTLPDQRTLSVAVAGALRLLSATAPILLAVDDTQWLDESSAAIIGYALRRLEDRPVGLLASVRSGSTGGGAALSSALPAERLERIRLGPMPLASLHRLFQLRLGRSFPRLVLVRIEAASGGNPLYALEIARALVDAAMPPDPHAPLPVPGSLGLLMADRISALPSASRRALLLAAAAAEPSIDTLDRAEPGAAEALAPAVADGVVTLDGSLVRFGHPLLGQAVIALAKPAELRRAHADLALATRSPDGRARHLGQAVDGPDESVAEALADAAARARNRGGTLDAAALYLFAARATPREMGPDRLERALLAAECLFIDLSEIVQADEILAAAIGDAPAGPARAKALSLRAILRYYHGRPADAVRMGEQALAEAGDEPVLRSTILGRLAFLVMQLELERGLALVEEAITTLESSPSPVDPDLLANALLLRANAEIGLVRPTRQAAIDRGLALMTVYGRSWEREGADGSAFGLARQTDDLDRAIEMTRELIRAKSGPGGDDPFNLVQLSGLLLFRGEWREARRVAEAALDGYEQEAVDLHRAWGLRGVALVAAHDGRLDDARQLAREGLRIASERGDVVVTAFHRQILGFVALSRDEWPEANAQLGAAAGLAAGIAIQHPGRFKLAGDQVEAALALGDVDAAARVVASLERASNIAPTPWVRAVGARSAALLAAARGDLQTAARSIDQALVEHAALPMPFERARTLLAKGQIHRRRKEKRLADEALRAALAGFDALGAPAWSDRARTELARVGLRPRAPETLTETERHVAALAARGLSSRQIAEQAFLAPKTVGNVLGRIYLKLGIHSRAELGARMSGAGEDVTPGGRDAGRIPHHPGVDVPGRELTPEPE